MERDTNQAILRKLSKHKFKDNIGPSLIDIYAWETGDTYNETDEIILNMKKAEPIFFL